MEILGIGFGELLLIVLIILILFGPKEMVKTGRTLGQWLNRMVRSPTYQVLTKTGEEIKNLPRNLMREANLQEVEQEVREIGQSVRGQIGGSFASSFDENKIFEALEAGKKIKTEEEESAPQPSAEEFSSAQENPSNPKEA
jgi:Sec-independent protein translocase protein TatA